MRLSELTELRDYSQRVAAGQKAREISSSVVPETAAREALTRRGGLSITETGGQPRTRGLGELVQVVT